MAGFKHLFLNRIKRYKKDKDGATAIEFAILAIPFFMLLFGILELAIIFFISSTMTHAVGEAGRQIRTGNFQACGGKDEFKALVCANMSNVGNCEKRVRIDVVTNSSFGTITMPAPPDPPDPTPGDPDPDIPNGDYVNTGASVPVVVRALYYHNLILPSQLTRLENMTGKGIHRLTTTTAFRNEPFPAVGTCPTTP